MALKDFYAEARRCSQCSYCKWVPFDQVKSVRYSRGCPSIAYANFQAYSARGKYSTALAWMDGRIEYNDKMLEVANLCQLCGSCDTACKICRYNLEPLDMIKEFRAELVSKGHTVTEHKKIITGLAKSNNMLLKPKAGRGAWADGLEVKDLSAKKGSVLFHAGCRFSYGDGQQDVARTAVTLLSKGGVDIGIMGAEENCCGGRAYNMGYRDEFNKQMEKNVAAWKKAGVKTIVTSCADCYHTFKRLYAANGAKFEVLHTVEYLEKLINEGKLKLTKKLPLKITYHDPCNLGRQGEPYIPWKGKEKKLQGQIVAYEPRRPRYLGANGIYDAPRNVLKAIPGIQLREMERIREYSWCCGSGPGVKEAYPDFAKWTATDRLEEAKETGAEAIVSACGWCENNFRDTIAANGDKLQVFDVAELVKKAL
jgi:Fe-S oxidoreductase